ncbi:MAG TPA: hypothetical protein VJB69_00125 [Candidatus Paceibacterota bacterium]
MSKWFNKAVLVFGVALLPTFAFAQDGTVPGIFRQIQNILNIVIPIVMTLALLYFFWGLANYILGAGDEEKRASGRGMMIYGIIALFAMAAVWGLVEVLNNTFLGGVNIGAPPVDILIPR